MVARWSCRASRFCGEEHTVISKSCFWAAVTLRRAGWESRQTQSWVWGQMDGSHECSQGTPFPGCILTRPEPREPETKVMQLRKASVWMNEEDGVHMYNGILLSLCSNMDGHRDGHTNWSKIDRKTDIWFHLNVESNLCHKLTYLQNQNRHGDVQNRPREQMCG